jgi:hypothetical protein
MPATDRQGMNHTPDFKCKQCGNCCLNLSGAIAVCATKEDIRLWKENGRADILA